MLRLAPSGPVLPFLGQMTFRTGTASGSTPATPPLITRPEGLTSWGVVTVPPKGLRTTAIRWQGRGNNGLALTGSIEARLMYADDGVNYVAASAHTFDSQNDSRGYYVKENLYLAPGSKFFFEQRMLTGALTSNYFIVIQLFFFEGSAPQ